MTITILVDHLLEICKQDIARVNGEVVIKNDKGEIHGIAKVQWQAEAEEIQILVRPL